MTRLDKNVQSRLERARHRGPVRPHYVRSRPPRPHPRNPDRMTLAEIFLRGHVVYEAAGGTAALRILWFTVLVLAVAGVLIADCSTD